MHVPAGIQMPALPSETQITCLRSVLGHSLLWQLSHEFASPPGEGRGNMVSAVSLLSASHSLDCPEGVSYT